MNDSSGRPRATVINHDADLLDLLCDLLEEHGFECETHTSALPGIDALTASRPDLIVVDLGVRHVREQQTGLQIVHAARSSTALRDVPIVVLTTDVAALADAWPEVMERGDIHRLEKPFDGRTFARVVNTAMQRAQNGSDPARPSGPHALSDSKPEAHTDQRQESEG